MSGLTSRLYAAAPVWVQNLGISLYGLSWRQERLGGRFGEYVAQFRDREHWPADRFLAYLDEEVRRVVTRAFATVPHYQRKWSEAGLHAGDLRTFRQRDLPRLPVTRKSDLRAQPEEFVSSPSEASGRLRRYSSSGTTGTPITAICSVDGHRRFIAAREARSFNWAGTSVLGSRSMLGGRLVVPKGNARPPFHRYNWAEQQVYFSAYHISPATAPHYVAALNRHRPRVLTGYASAHYLLGRMMLEGGLRLMYQPEALVLSSEKLTPPMKAVLREAFNARAYEEYGCVENCVLATECEQGRLHANPDFGILEIVDDAGRPVPPGVEGRVLCTSLQNEVQPLIRYEIGDVAAWSSEPCPCGRQQLPVLQEVVGRLEDVVTGPDGRQMVRFHGIFIGLANVIEGQVIQETLHRFTVRLVTTDAFGDPDRELIRRRFAERLGEVEVTLEQVPLIPRTERGKFRAVISRVGLAVGQPEVTSGAARQTT